MSNDKQITVTLADPCQAEIKALIESLDIYMLGLYPAESTHRVDPTTFASQNARFFSALLDCVVVGCGGILLKNNYAEIKRIFVSPQARGLGVGHKLLERLETEARQLGFNSLRLETGIYQPEALALFRTRGFAPRLSFGDSPENDPNSIFMEKQISS